MSFLRQPFFFFSYLRNPLKGKLMVDKMFAQSINGEFIRFGKPQGI